MSHKIWTVAPEPWQIDETAAVAIKDAKGKVICWLNKEHPNVEGNTHLICAAAMLASAIYRHLTAPSVPAQKALGDTWKIARTKQFQQSPQK